MVCNEETDLALIELLTIEAIYLPVAKCLPLAGAEVERNVPVLAEIIGSLKRKIVDQRCTGALVWRCGAYWGCNTTITTIQPDLPSVYRGQILCKQTARACHYSSSGEQKCLHTVSYFLLNKSQI